MVTSWTERICLFGQMHFALWYLILDSRRWMWLRDLIKGNKGIQRGCIYTNLIE